MYVIKECWSGQLLCKTKAWRWDLFPKENRGCKALNNGKFLVRLAHTWICKTLLNGKSIHLVKMQNSIQRLHWEHHIESSIEVPWILHCPEHAAMTNKSSNSPSSKASFEALMNRNADSGNSNVIERDTFDNPYFQGQMGAAAVTYGIVMITMRVSE